MIHELNISSLKELFSTFNYVGNYQPISFLSLAIDYSIVGEEPMLYHVHSLLLHLMNVALLYGFVFLITRNKWQAIICSLLFAIHPMHVEAVTWISSRKDVLFTCYFLIGLIAYELTKQEKLNSKKGLILMYFCFILAILSKAMAVVFPMILLSLDFLQSRKLDWRNLLSKAPLFIISLAFGLLAIWAQADENAVSSYSKYPFHEQLLMGIHGCVLYLMKSIVPFQLSVYHPYPSYLSGVIPVSVLVSSIAFISLLIFSIIQGRKNRAVGFGFLFFIFSIAPVLQILAVGNSLISERFSYLSYIGLFFIYSYFLEKLIFKWKGKLRWIIGLGLFSIGLSFGLISHQHSLSFNNDENLWSKAIASYPSDYFVWFKRGAHFAKKGEFEKGLNNLNKSLELEPNYTLALNNRGMVFQFLNEQEKALADFNKTISLDPNFHLAYLNRGLIYMNQKNLFQARKDFEDCLALSPNFIKAHLNLGVLNELEENTMLALEEYNKAIALDPNYALSYKFKSVLLFKNYRLNEALNQINECIKIDPDFAEAWYWKSRILFELKSENNAKWAAKEALSRNYVLPQWYLNALGI